MVHIDRRGLESIPEELPVEMNCLWYKADYSHRAAFKTNCKCDLLLFQMQSHCRVPAAVTQLPCQRWTKSEVSRVLFPVPFQLHGNQSSQVIRRWLKILGQTPVGETQGLGSQCFSSFRRTEDAVGCYTELLVPQDSSSISFPCSLTKRKGWGFQKYSGRDSGNISLKLPRISNKSDLSNIVVWVWLLVFFFFFSFLAKTSGKEYRAMTTLQFMLWAVLEEKDVGGLGIEKG